MTNMIFEFECEECGHEFEELVDTKAKPPPCPKCESTKTRRIMTPHPKHTSWPV
jgi:putative FmdB family regulatory protein